MKNKSLLITILGAVVFPLAVLVPFAIHSSQKLFVLGDLPGCANTTHIVAINQCITFDTPKGVDQVALVAAIMLVILGFISLRYIHGKRQVGGHLAKINLAVVAVVAALALSTFGYMHDRGQQMSYPANRVGVSVKDIKTHTVKENWQFQHPPQFGYGLKPEQVTFLSALFILPPAMVWYRNIVDPTRIKGIKKKELFQ